MVCRLQGIDVCNTFASQSIFHSLHGVFFYRVLIDELSWEWYTSVLRRCPCVTTESPQNVNVACTSFYSNHFFKCVYIHRWERMCVYTHRCGGQGWPHLPQLFLYFVFLIKALLLNLGFTDGSGICLSTLLSALGLPLQTFYIDAGDPNSHPDACTPPHPSLAKPSLLPFSPF